MNPNRTWLLHPRHELFTLLAAALLVPAGLIRGQEERRLRDAGSLNGQEAQKMIAFAGGRAQVTDADQALLNRAAKWYVNRLTWKDFQNPPAGEIEKTMPALVKQARRVIPDASKGPLDADPQQYMEMFAKPLLTEVKAVLQNPEWIARVNAARLLASLGNTGMPIFGDALADVVKDPKQSDAVKLYALRGLGNLLRLMERDNLFVHKTLPERTRWTAAVLAFINRKPTVAPTAPAAELDGLRYVRREAIRALANTRVPVDESGNVQTALVLVRLLRKDGYTPEPSLSEQIEAAIAIARLNPKLADSYQADYALNQVGHFLAEFLAGYENERAELTRKKDEEKEKDARLLTQAWLVQAARMAEALDELKEIIGTRDGYATGLIDHYTNPLRAVQNKSPTSPTDLAAWLRKNPVPAGKGSVYKGDDKSVVRTGSGAASE
jgi:hypothetical protein